MRASFVVLGPLWARAAWRWSLPGGCVFGHRRSICTEGLRDIGAVIEMTATSASRHAARWRDVLGGNMGSTVLGTPTW